MKDMGKVVSHGTLRIVDSGMNRIARRVEGRQGASQEALEDFERQAQIMRQSQLQKADRDGQDEADPSSPLQEPPIRRRGPAAFARRRQHASYPLKSKRPRQQSSEWGPRATSSTGEWICQKCRKDRKRHNGHKKCCCKEKRTDSHCSREQHSDSEDADDGESESSSGCKRSKCSCTKKRPKKTCEKCSCSAHHPIMVPMQMPIMGQQPWMAQQVLADPYGYGQMGMYGAQGMVQDPYSGPRWMFV